MSAKFKWGLFASMLIINNEILSWAILTILIIAAAWPIVKGGVTLD